MNSIHFRAVAILLGTFSILSLQSPAGAAGPESEKGIPVRLAADYVHAVIEAGRTTYSEAIVDRLHQNLQATENWQEDGTLLLPAQFLLSSSQISNKRGIGMRYRLMSLWPINPKNSSKTKNEERGLEEVARNPDKPFTWIVQRAGMWYYEAIYPDRAVAETCVSCHNSHPKSPKTDFKRGDVMGGLIIDLPLGKHFRKTTDIRIPPEVVTDYVFSILESDRAVYAQNIVERLGKQNIIQAREDWKETKALMLPAQFLMSTSDRMREKNLDLDFELISLWPINPSNAPGNEFERTGLEAVEIHPIRPHMGRIRVGRKHFFQAVYPDRAVTPACVTCHNAHPKSSKRDFKLHDVMGGFVITLPLN